MKPQIQVGSQSITIYFKDEEMPLTIWVNGRHSTFGIQSSSQNTKMHVGHLETINEIVAAVAEFEARLTEIAKKMKD